MFGTAQLPCFFFFVLNYITDVFLFFFSANLPLFYNYNNLDLTLLSLFLLTCSLAFSLFLFVLRCPLHSQSHTNILWAARKWQKIKQKIRFLRWKENVNSHLIPFICTLLSWSEIIVKSNAINMGKSVACLALKTCGLVSLSYFSLGSYSHSFSLFFSLPLHAANKKTT